MLCCKLYCVQKAYIAAVSHDAEYVSCWQYAVFDVNKSHGTCSVQQMFPTLKVMLQHSVAALLRHCFGWLQHCSSIATLRCAKNRRCESSRVTSPLTKFSPFISRSSYTRCDCCDGPMFGPGVRVIRAPPEMFGIKNLPFLFNACTQTCRRQFSKSPQSLQEWMKRNVPLNTSF